MSCKLFWRTVRLTYPWIPLMVMLWRVTTATDNVRRTHAQVRFWLLYSRIDFGNLLAIAIDLIQPEYWA